MTARTASDGRALSRDRAKAAEIDVDALFRAYAPYVAAIGLRLLGRGDSELDDLVQDVFLSAVRGLSRLRDPDAIRGWLATLTVRHARRRLRQRRIRHFFHGSEVDPARIADPGAPAEARAMLMALYRALERLPVNDRLAWSLRHLHGASLAEVANHCECSLATAKRRIKRAQDRLREEVGHG